MDDIIRYWLEFPYYYKEGDSILTTERLYIHPSKSETIGIKKNDRYEVVKNIFLVYDGRDVTDYELRFMGLPIDNSIIKDAENGVFDKTTTKSHLRRYNYIVRLIEKYNRGDKTPFLEAILQGRLTPKLKNFMTYKDDYDRLKNDIGIIVQSASRDHLSMVNDIVNRIKYAIEKGKNDRYIYYSVRNMIYHDVPNDLTLADIKFSEMASNEAISVFNSDTAKSRARNRVEQISKELRNFVPTRVLDIGSSDGTITEALASKYDLPKTDVIGYDITIPPNKDGRTFTFVKSIEGPLDLPFEDASFDFVMCIVSLHHIPNLENSFKEIFRILKPNGRLIVREHDSQSKEFGTFLDIQHGFYEMVWSNPMEDPDHPFHFYANYYTKTTLERKAIELGFIHLNAKSRAATPNGPLRIFLDLFVKPGERSRQAERSEVILETGFPFKRLYTSNDEIARRFQVIRNINLKLIHRPYAISNIPSMGSRDLQYAGRPYTLIVPRGYDTDDISDHFAEDVRIKARRKDEELTLEEWWGVNGKPYAKSETKNVRESLYGEYNGKRYHEVTTFRPSVIRTMIRMLDIDSVLDFSAGWGDRLIGSMAANIERYTGVDPNLDIPYDEIERFFKGRFDIKTKVNIINKPFEEVEDSELDTYDMTFTSPPYFDLEIYTDDPTQSIHKRNTVDQWLNEFLYASLRKCIRHTRKYIVLVINDIRGEASYVTKILKELDTWNSVEYMGVISYGKERTYGREVKTTEAQPMWIWRVVEPAQDSISDESPFEGLYGQLNEVTRPTIEVNLPPDTSSDKPLMKQQDEAYHRSLFADILKNIKAKVNDIKKIRMNMFVDGFTKIKDAKEYIQLNGIPADMSREERYIRRIPKSFWSNKDTAFIQELDKKREEELNSKFEEGYMTLDIALGNDNMTILYYPKNVKRIRLYNELVADVMIHARGNPILLPVLDLDSMELDTDLYEGYFEPDALSKLIANLKEAKDNI